MEFGSNFVGFLWTQKMKNNMNMMRINGWMMMSPGFGMSSTKKEAKKGVREVLNRVRVSLQLR